MIKKTIKIKWLSNYYNWQWIDPENDDCFTTEDYININSSIQLVRIDPEEARENMWVAKNINFLNNNKNAGFLLYECDSPSKIRKNIPLRFFYSKKYGKVFELKGDSKNIYEMFDFVFKNEDIKKDILGNLKDYRSWLAKFFEEYVRVFFDNVKGRHGRFELIKAYNDDKSLSSYKLLSNRIEKYYELNPNTINNKLMNENFKFHIEIYKYLNRKDKEKIKIIVPNEKGKDDFNKTISKKTEFIWKDCLMIFKSSFFKANITADTNEIGRLDLKDGTMLSFFDIYEENKQKNKLNGNLSDEQIDKLKSQDIIYPLQKNEKDKININKIN